MRILGMISVLVLTMSTVACGQTGYKNLSSTEVKKMIDKGQVTVVDVRTPGEWNAGHINGATHIDINRPDFVKKVTELQAKKKPIVVYCAAGGRSAKAAGMLSGSGITNVINMTGGFSEWEQKGFPIAK